MWSIVQQIAEEHNAFVAGQHDIPWHRDPFAANGREPFRCRMGCAPAEAPLDSIGKRVQRLSFRPRTSLAASLGSLLTPIARGRHLLALLNRWNWDGFGRNNVLDFGSYLGFTFGTWNNRLIGGVRRSI